LTLAPPKPGTIIRYAYLWVDQYRRGREEGDKDRPALVLTLSVRADDGAVHVLVLAITHAAPIIDSDAVLVPAAVKARLGMDKEPSWIVTIEANTFIYLARAGSASDSGPSSAHRRLWPHSRQSVAGSRNVLFVQSQETKISNGPADKLNAKRANVELRIRLVQHDGG
jgi:hypothetical protein